MQKANIYSTGNTLTFFVCSYIKLPLRCWPNPRPQCLALTTRRQASFHCVSILQEHMPSSPLSPAEAPIQGSG